MSVTRSAIFKAVYLFTVWLYFNLLNQYSIGEHRCFYFILPPISNALKNIFVYVSVWFFISLGCAIRGRMSGLREDI